MFKGARTGSAHPTPNNQREMDDEVEAGEQERGQRLRADRVRVRLKTLCRR